MKEPKSLTEKAMAHKREAYLENVCRPDGPNLTGMHEREAARLLTLPNPPDVGAHGEVILEPTPGLPSPQFAIRDTLRQKPTRTAEDASIRRTDLLLQENFDCVGLGIDAAQSINAGNSLEKVLAHQMSVAHEMALRLVNRAMGYGEKWPGDQVEACRLANASARLMGAFQDGVLALAKLRTGNSQTVTVQHVNVAAGAQAVIGNVQTGVAETSETVRAPARDRGLEDGGSDDENG